VAGYAPGSAYRYGSATGSGGVISWPNAISLSPNTVYYWRVADDSVSVDPVRFKWNESSFIYIPGKTGWSEAHFHQFKDDEYTNVRYDTTGRKFEFVQNNASLTALNYGSHSLTTQQLNETGYYLNSTLGDYGGCGFNPAVMVAVIDSVTLRP